MNTADFDTRFKQAASVASPPRSIVDDVMRRLPLAPPEPASRSRWRHPVLVAGLAAFTGIAAALVFIFFIIGPSVSLTLAEVQAAVVKQPWVHIRYDAGQTKERWTNLQTGEIYASQADGDAVYIDEQANTRLWYWKNSEVIEQDKPTIYPPGQRPTAWTPQTAWEQFIAPFEQAAASTQPASSSAPFVISARDAVNGVAAVRFDIYNIDAVGNRFLYSQLWADPSTSLPICVKTRLQLGERERELNGKEWSTGDYDFPRTGPTDLFALGVPRGTPTEQYVTTAPTDVQPIVDRINHNHDSFLKNYRAIVLTVNMGSVDPLDSLDIIWRDVDKVRQDHHIPAVELQDHPSPPLPKLTTVALLSWASQHEPIEKQLMDSEREYSWVSAATVKASKPQVHVIGHGSFPFLATGAWPENIQWPTRYFAPDYHLLPPNADAPIGCIGLSNDDGNRRLDYYIDPKNDYVCIKQIDWKKRGGKWAKSREVTLSDLHRVVGRVVAGTQQLHDYGDSAQHLSAYTETITIDLVPLTPADYPPGTFDPASLTHGANVIGY